MAKRSNKFVKRQQLFEVLNEIGIIQQLATTEFNRQLPEGLHVSHFGVINHLVRLGDGRTPLRIASAFQVSKANMTNTLSKLADRRLITIEPHPTDGRSKQVFLTEKGRAFREQALESLAPSLDALGKHFDATKAATLLPALRELREFLDQARDT